MAKREKTTIFFIVFFSIVAIAFALLYVFGVIKSLDAYLAATYMSYFLGLALMYFGSYQKRKEHFKSMYLCYILSIILILLAIAALVYGIYTGNITLFP